MKNKKEYVNINKDMNRKLRDYYGNKVVYESSTWFEYEDEMENNDNLIENTIEDVIIYDYSWREVIDYKYEIDLKNREVLVKYTYFNQK